MSIKLAFSTVACPDWTIDQVVAKADEFGYDGIELRTLGGGGEQIASDPALTDIAKVKAAFEGANAKPVCLSTSIEMHHGDTTTKRRAQAALEDAIDQAAEIGCEFVRIFGFEVGPGENRRAVVQRIAENVLPLADKAGERGVRLLFENAGSFNVSKDWWWLFNLTEHPSVGLVWNVANAAAAGEGPGVSVPTLNSRIALAKVKDTEIGVGSGFVPLGEGTVEVEHFVKRMMGIGYRGYVTFEWDRAWLSSLAPADEALPAAKETLSGWITAITEDLEAAKAKLAKAAAKNAPKKRSELAKK